MSKKWEVFQTSTDHAAQVAHDAQAPIAAIKVALREQGTRGMTLSEDMKKISQQALSRLETILNDLQSGHHSNTSNPSLHDTMRPDTFSDTINYRDQSAKATVAESIAKIVREKTSLLNFDLKREIRINQKIDSQTHGLRAVGPQSYLERALSNILDNAIEATPMNEPICIQIKTSCANGEMSIAVLDTGIGIPEEIIPIIGKTPVSYRKEGGSGRGLYFVHRFLQNVDGLLKISNIKSGLKKGGTQVVITIPILH